MLFKIALCGTNFEQVKAETAIESRFSGRETEHAKAPIEAWVTSCMDYQQKPTFLERLGVRTLKLYTPPQAPPPTLQGR